MVPTPPTIKNEQQWLKRCRKLRALANRIVSGEVAVIEGSRQVLKYQFWLHAGDDADFRIFAAVNSKSLHLPVGLVRANWQPDALRMKDEEVAALENLYRKEVVNGAVRLQAKYQ